MLKLSYDIRNCPINHSPTVWKAPNDNNIKAIFDAFVQRGKGTGFSVIYRDSKGQPMAVATLSIPHSYAIKVAESLAF